MKFLVVLFLSVAAVSAVPIENDYLLPAAPPVAIVPAPPQVVNLPVSNPVLEPVGVTVARTTVPFAPAPLRFLNPAVRFNPAPLPVARFAQPAQIPLAASPFRAGPFVGAPVPLAAPVAAPIATPLAAPIVPVAAPNSQFHAQDEFGGFSFGFQNGVSARQESKTPDGVTRGSYSYVDANGQLQEVQYIADPINGFRVAGTNLPVFNGQGPVTPFVPAVAGPVPVADTPEVVAARAEFTRAFEEAVASHAAAAAAVDVPEPVVKTLSLKKREAISEGYGLPAAPVVHVVPVPAPAPQLAGVIRTHTVTPLINPAPLLPAPLRVAPAPLPVAAPQFAQRVLPNPALPFAVPHALPFPAPVGARFFNPAALPAVAAAPAPVPAAVEPVIVKAAEPVAVIPAPVPTVNSQFQAQDEFGAFSFGYQNDLSARQETRSPDGVTRGSYSYVDANGITQTVNYIADAVNGFQVQGTNLPVAPVA